jgi:anti-sigma B factor antagonist
MAGIRVEQEHGYDVVTLTGEHDLTTVAELDRALASVMSATTGGCLIDLSGSSFIDSSIIRALLRWSKETQVSEREALGIVIGAPTSPSARTLALVGLLERLPVFETRADAVGALEDGHLPRAERPLRWPSDRELADAGAVALAGSTESDATELSHRRAVARLEEVEREQQRRRDEPA